MTGVIPFEAIFSVCFSFFLVNLFIATDYQQDFVGVGRILVFVS